MSVIKRHDEILRLVRESDSIEVEDLATAFGVTTQTIRQDLRSLDTQGFLKRTHGGARKLDTVTTRTSRAAGAKQRGKAKHRPGGGGIDPDRCSVMLNIGTTTEQVAQALRHHSELMVISNNINIITQLSGTTRRTLFSSAGACGKATAQLSARTRWNSSPDTRWITPSLAVRPSTKMERS